MRPSFRRGTQSTRKAARDLLHELPSFLKLLYRLLRDSRVQRADKLLFAAVAAYVVAPADLVPDFLGMFGLVDDLYLLGLALGRLLTRAGPDLLLQHWDGNPRSLGYLVEGVEQLGEMLPGPIRGMLRGTAAETPGGALDEDPEATIDTRRPLL
jgi:uncharacterized membrane protein YkvA (DUF1232 family)